MHWCWHCGCNCQKLLLVTNCCCCNCACCCCCCCCCCILLLMLLLLLHQLLLLLWLHLLLVYMHCINVCLYTCNLQIIDCTAILAQLIQRPAMGVAADYTILQIGIGSLCCNCCYCCIHTLYMQCTLQLLLLQWKRPCRLRRPCRWPWRRHCRLHLLLHLVLLQQLLHGRWPWLLMQLLLLLQPSVVVLL